MGLLQACSGVVVVTGPMVRVVRVALTYLVPIWGYYEYTRAVLEYMWVCGSWWAPAMGQWLHMGPSQACSGVVVVPWVTTQLQQALQGSSRFSMGLPGSSKCVKNIFFWIFGVISRLAGQVGTKIGQL